VSIEQEELWGIIYPKAVNKRQYVLDSPTGFSVSFALSHNPRASSVYKAVVIGSWSSLGDDSASSGCLGSAFPREDAAEIERLVRKYVGPHDHGKPKRITSAFDPLGGYQYPLQEIKLTPGSTRSPVKRIHGPSFPPKKKTIMPIMPMGFEAMTPLVLPSPKHSQHSSSLDDGLGDYFSSTCTNGRQVPADPLSPPVFPSMNPQIISSSSSSSSGQHGHRGMAPPQLESDRSRLSCSSPLSFENSGDDATPIRPMEFGGFGTSPPQMNAHMQPLSPPALPRAGSFRSCTSGELSTSSHTMETQHTEFPECRWN